MDFEVQTTHLSAGHVPGVADHELEVVVAVDGGADVGVVVDEVVAGEAAVGRGVEGVEEVEQRLLRRHLARRHL